MHTFYVTILQASTPVFISWVRILAGADVRGTRADAQFAVVLTIDVFLTVTIITAFAKAKSGFAETDRLVGRLLRCVQDPSIPSSRRLIVASLHA